MSRRLLATLVPFIVASAMRVWFVEGHVEIFAT
jgi:hypothetical protein